MWSAGASPHLSLGENPQEQARLSTWHLPHCTASHLLLLSPNFDDQLDPWDVHLDPGTFNSSPRRSTCSATCMIAPRASQCLGVICRGEEGAQQRQMNACTGPLSPNNNVAHATNAAHRARTFWPIRVPATVTDAAATYSLFLLPLLSGFCEIERPPPPKQSWGLGLRLGNHLAGDVGRSQSCSVQSRPARRSFHLRSSCGFDPLAGERYAIVNRVGRFNSHLHEAVKKVPLALVAPLLIFGLLPARVVAAAGELPLHGQLGSSLLGVLETRRSS